MTSKHLIHRLLAGENRMMRSEKDAVLARVLRATDPKRRRRIGLALALAGAAAVAVIVPLARKGDGFTARGSAAAVAAFEVRCPRGACQVGDVLAFDLSASAGYRYFAAFARTDDGTIVWYVPDSDDLDAHLADGMLTRGVTLERAGHVVVYGVFSSAPLSRDDIKARFSPGATSVGPGTAVTTRELTIR